MSLNAREAILAAAKVLPRIMAITGLIFAASLTR